MPRNGLRLESQNHACATLRLPAAPEISVNINQTYEFIQLSLSQPQFGIEGSAVGFDIQRGATPAVQSIVWTNTVDEVGTVGQRDVPAVVSEMNRTTERAIEKLLTPPPAGRQ